MPRFPFFRQLEAMDCGPTCLRMIARHYGRTYTAAYLRELCSVTRAGASFFNLSRAAEELGFRTWPVRIPFERLMQASLPAIVHWRSHHMLVVHRISGGKVFVADPAQGRITYPVEEFTAGWLTPGRNDGVALLLEPAPELYRRDQDEPKAGVTVRRLGANLVGHPWAMLRLLIVIVAGSLLPLAVPLLVKALTDLTLGHRDLGLAGLLLLGYLAVSATRFSVEALHRRTILILSARLEETVIAPAVGRLARRPPSFLETRHTQDILQSIGDHRKAESFLISTLPLALMDLGILMGNAFLLAFFSREIFALVAIATAVGAVWPTFLKDRRHTLDRQRIHQQATSKGLLTEIFEGLWELKLYGALEVWLHRWEKSQRTLFQLNRRSLHLTELHEGGAVFLREGRNLLTILLAAREVLQGNMTLGVLAGVVSILGQIDSPLQRLLKLSEASQEIRLGLDRLENLHDLSSQPFESTGLEPPPGPHDIEIEGLSLLSPAQPNPKRLSFRIPAGKITAVLDLRGSGKISLVRFLLKLNSFSEGTIRVGGTDLGEISSIAWWRRCGCAVLEGKIFSDSIAHNIGLYEEEPDAERLAEAARVAGIDSFIRSLPRSYETLIEPDSPLLSREIVHRLFIARAVYKDPDFLFLDKLVAALGEDDEAALLQRLARSRPDRTLVLTTHQIRIAELADHVLLLEPEVGAEE